VDAPSLSLIQNKAVKMQETASRCRRIRARSCSSGSLDGTCDLMDCAEHKFGLILHDPVGAARRQHITPLGQALRDGFVLLASFCRRGFCREDHDGLAAKIA
jgi:hypothetical protein